MSSSLQIVNKYFKQVGKIILENNFRQVGKIILLQNGTKRNHLVYIRHMLVSLTKIGISMFNKNVGLVLY